MRLSSFAIVVSASVVLLSLGVTGFAVATYGENDYVREVAGRDGVWKVSADQSSRVLVSRETFLEFYVGRAMGRELTRDELRDIPVAADSESWLEVPAGYEADILAGSLERPRVMAWDPAGRLLVSETVERGRVRSYAFNADGSVDGKIILDGERQGASRLLNVHGLAFHDGKLYTASEHALEAWEYDAESGEIVGEGELVMELPPGTGTFAGQGHKTRTLVEGSDGFLYLSVGSNCDHCADDLDRYAGIWRLDTRTGELESFARGLRNTVFFVESDTPGIFYGNDMGQDNLGEELPPDELNVLVSGGQYGWPFCYGDGVAADPARGSFCAETVAPAFAYAAHSAPLGIRRVPEAFSDAWAGDLLVAEHGSVIRADSIAGYKIVRVTLDDEGTPVRDEDAITGFVRGDNIPFGRPVDMIFGPDGALYVTVDHAGVIHRIRKNF